MTRHFIELFFFKKFMHLAGSFFKNKKKQTPLRGLLFILSHINL